MGYEPVSLVSHLNTRVLLGMGRLEGYYELEFGSAGLGTGKDVASRSCFNLQIAGRRVG